MLVAAAICTWNRAPLLDKTLRQMRTLRIPAGIEWELLIVNNNCTDDTDRVIDEHSPHLPIRRLFEEKMGLSNARNRAVTATRGELLLWTDDDVLVDSCWLAEYVSAANRWPAASVFGGKILPWFEAPPPRWLADNLPLLGRYFALRDLGDREIVLDGELPFGANMAFRTRVLRDYVFDANLGRVGTAMISGEDVQVMRRMQAAGHCVVWVPSASVKHFLPQSRMTFDYMKKLLYCSGRYESRRDAPQESTHVFGVPRWVVRKWLTAETGYLMASLAPSHSVFRLRKFIAVNHFRGVLDSYRKGDERKN
jgi:glucosyl-dolichyl phosphate glucuronosyltransferase